MQPALLTDQLHNYTKQLKEVKNLYKSKRLLLTPPPPYKFLWAYMEGYGGIGWERDNVTQVMLKVHVYMQYNAISDFLAAIISFQDPPYVSCTGLFTLVCS